MEPLKHPMTNRLWTIEQSVFRNTLKTIRKNANISQTELAQRLGKPQSYVSKYESGERRLDFLEVREICLHCGVSVQEFEVLFSTELGTNTSLGNNAEQVKN